MAASTTSSRSRRNNGSMWFDGASLREYQYFRSRYGFAGSTDYRSREGSNVYARFLYSDFENYGDRWAYQLQDNTPDVSLLAPRIKAAFLRDLIERGIEAQSSVPWFEKLQINVRRPFPGAPMLVRSIPRGGYLPCCERSR